MGNFFWGGGVSFIVVVWISNSWITCSSNTKRIVWVIQLIDPQDHALLTVIFEDKIPVNIDPFTMQK